MPYTQNGLPWSGATVTSRHCSYTGAEEATIHRAHKTMRYVQWLQRVGMGTDHQAADDLGYPLSSINSIRNGLGARVEPAGWIRHGRTKRTRWRLARLTE